MQERNVIARVGGGSVVTMSLVAMAVIAALIGLLIWQPWNATNGSQHFMTITTQPDHATANH